MNILFQKQKQRILFQKQISSADMAGYCSWRQPVEFECVNADYLLLLYPQRLSCNMGNMLLMPSWHSADSDWQERVPVWRMEGIKEAESASERNCFRLPEEHLIWLLHFECCQEKKKDQIMHAVTQPLRPP